MRHMRAQGQVAVRAQGQVVPCCPQASCATHLDHGLKMLRRGALVKEGQTLLLSLRTPWGEDSLRHMRAQGQVVPRCPQASCSTHLEHGLKSLGQPERNCHTKLGRPRLLTVLQPCRNRVAELMVSHWRVVVASATAPELVVCDALTLLGLRTPLHALLWQLFTYPDMRKNRECHRTV